MTQTQKIIKYVALAFAAFLTVVIILTIFYALAFAYHSFKNDNGAIMENLETVLVEPSVSSLEIDVKYTSITIQTGETVQVKTNNDHVQTYYKNGKLVIKEKKRNLFFNGDKGDLIVYIPENMILEKLEINAGAGNIRIAPVVAKEIDLDLGAGKVEIENMIAHHKADIDGGTGELLIHNGYFYDLDLDVGVGKVSLTSTLFGNTKIDAGVGEVVVNLLGNKSDYKIRVDKGIGSAKLDGENIKSDVFYGTGKNSLEIDGGVGSISVQFKEQVREHPYQLEIDIKDYLKNSQNQILLLGEIITGNIDVAEVELWDEDNKKIGTVRILEFYSTMLDDPNCNQVVIVLDAPEALLRRTTRLVISKEE